MCGECIERAKESVGKPMPDAEELLTGIMSRAELNVDLHLQQEHSEVVTEDGARLLRLGIHQTMRALAEAMQEENLVLCPTWVAFLGQARGMEIMAEREEQSSGTHPEV